MANCDLEWAEVRALLERRLALETSRLLAILGERETGICQGRAQVLTELLRLPEVLRSLREMEKEAGKGA